MSESRRMYKKSTCCPCSTALTVSVVPTPPRYRTPIHADKTVSPRKHVELVPSFVRRQVPLINCVLYFYGRPGFPGKCFRTAGIPTQSFVGIFLNRAITFTLNRSQGLLLFFVGPSSRIFYESCLDSGLVCNL